MFILGHATLHNVSCNMIGTDEDWESSCEKKKSFTVPVGFLGNACDIILALKDIAVIFPLSGTKSRVCTCEKEIKEREMRGEENV